MLLFTVGSDTNTFLVINILIIINKYRYCEIVQIPLLSESNYDNYDN